MTLTRTKSIAAAVLTLVAAGCSSEASRPPAAPPTAPTTETTHAIVVETAPTVGTGPPPISATSVADGDVPDGWVRMDESGIELDAVGTGARAGAGFADANLAYGAGSARIPLVRPPAGLHDDGTSFTLFTAGSGELTFIHVIEQPSDHSDRPSNITLQVSNATDVERSYVAEHATATVHDHPAVIGAELDADCPDVEEGGRNDTALTWLDGDLSLELHIQPVPLCESTVTLDDVLEIADHIVSCRVTEEGPGDCVRPVAHS